MERKCQTPVEFMKALNLNSGVTDMSRESSHEQAHTSLSVYNRIAAEGLEELARPNQSIIWSSIAAGLAISFSVIMEASLRAKLPDTDYRHLIESFGYTSGFLIVILCRLQLFTENTITPVLPVLKRRDKETVLSMLRLWGICFLGNMVGAFLVALALRNIPMLSSDTYAAITSISEHVAELGFWESLAKGIPAGFLIAALVWMLPSSKGFEFWVILVMTYLIALGDFTHVIAGSVELFYLGLETPSRLLELINTNLFPTLLGNVIGGTGLFTLIAWAQVGAEMGKS